MADHYIDSVAGSDAAATPNIGTPWKTLAKVAGHTFVAGDNIWLKRGSLFQNEKLTWTGSGSAGLPITVGVYSTGAKPIITGSINGETATWTETSTGSHIWRTLCSAGDVGNIIVNTVSGTTAVCHKYFHSTDTRTGATPKMPGDALPAVQGNFFHNTEAVSYYGSTSAYLYMYSVGNPNTVYDGIELAQDELQSSTYNKTYVTVQDLDFRYNSDMGCMFVMGGASGHHQIVERCDFRYIGGSIGRGSALAVRDGYAIQMANGGNNLTVRECTFNEVWNKAISLQSGIFSYIYCHHNVFDQCGNVFEAWLNGDNLDRCYWVSNTHYATSTGLYWNELKTFYNSGWLAMDMFHYTPAVTTYSNCVMKNNIFNSSSTLFQRLKGATPVWDLTGWDINYNDYYPVTYSSGKPFSDNGTLRTLTEWKAGVCCTPAPDAASISDDPTFTDAAGGDFTLVAGSPCFNTGVYVTGINTVNPPSIGRWETASGGGGGEGHPKPCFFRKS